MHTEQRRRRASFFLLTVYVLLLAGLSLHVHPQGVYADADCYQCANHLPHSGHLSAAQSAMHDCVLCSLQSSLWLPAVVVVVAAVLSMTARTFVQPCVGLAVASRRRGSTRAPPVG